MPPRKLGSAVHETAAALQRGLRHRGSSLSASAARRPRNCPRRQRRRPTRGGHIPEQSTSKSQGVVRLDFNMTQSRPRRLDHECAVAQDVPVLSAAPATVPPHGISLQRNSRATQAVVWPGEGSLGLARRGVTNVRRPTPANAKVQPAAAPARLIPRCPSHDREGTCTAPARITAHC